jgi:uncharacterized protein YycO
MLKQSKIPHFHKKYFILTIALILTVKRCIVSVKAVKITKMFSINPLRFFRRTQAVVDEAYRGASKMGKGKKLKSSDVTADFEKFENFIFQDSHVSGIVTCIADNMSESGLSFVHSDRDTPEKANNMVSEYDGYQISELTVANMVFGNSLTVE